MEKKLKQGIPPTSINPEHHNGIKFDIGKAMGLYQAQFTIGVQTFHVCERDSLKEAEWYKQQLIKAFSTRTSVPINEGVIHDKAQDYNAINNGGGQSFQDGAKWVLSLQGEWWSNEKPDKPKEIPGNCREGLKFEFCPLCSPDTGCLGCDHYIPSER